MINGLLALLWSVAVPLLIGGLALLILSAIVAPFESLGWWAGWFGQRADEQLAEDMPELIAGKHAVDANNFLVYLSGIGIPAADKQLIDEQPFIHTLKTQLPGTVVLSEIYPYSVTSIGLTSERLFGWVWDSVARIRLKNPTSALTWLVNIRNMLQVAVSADHRYGPVYNAGIAKAVLENLLRNGYRIGSKTPVILLGYSGGGQVAVGIAPYLRQALRAPIRVISLGGFISADPGLLALERIDHIVSRKDTTERLGAFVFAGRWSWVSGSPWNSAKNSGTLILHDLSPMLHTGKGGYLDREAFLADGQSHLEATIATVTQIITSGSKEG